MNITLQKDLETVAKAISEQDLNLLLDKLDVKTMAGREAVRMALANCLLLDRKQQDYGPENIADFSTFGVLVRMNDKMKRLKYMYNINGRRRKAINESINDSFRDLSNYGNIALMCELGLWP